MVRQLLLALLLVGLVPTAHAGIKADWQYDGKTEFSQWVTWAWGPSQEYPQGHPLHEGSPLDQELRSAVEEMLAKQGLRLADEGEEPDFRLVYRTLLTEEGRQPNPGPSHVTDASWPTVGSVRGHSLVKGTLLFEIVVPGRDLVVWNGWADDVARRPEELEKKATKAVKKIFKGFPPR